MPRRFLLTLVLLASVSATLTASAQARHLAVFIAPTAVCADQTNLGATPSEQERAMRCMTDFARASAGLGSLGNTPGLDWAARDKADDIVHCDNFSHYACGRQFTYWMRRVGYLEARCWRAGENIAWGTGSSGDVRSIFTAWIHSPEHRANILGRYSRIGIALSVGNLEGHSGAHVWTQQFGSHCGVAGPAFSPPPKLSLTAARRAR